MCDKYIEDIKRRVDNNTHRIDALEIRLNLLNSDIEDLWKRVDQLEQHPYIESCDD